MSTYISSPSRQLGNSFNILNSFSVITFLLSDAVWVVSYGVDLGNSRSSCAFSSSPSLSKLEWLSAGLSALFSARFDFSDSENLEDKEEEDEEDDEKEEEDEEDDEEEEEDEEDDEEEEEDEEEERSRGMRF